MQPIYVATRNAHKLAEFREILKTTPLEVVSLLDGPDVLKGIEVTEDCATLEGNAIKKAFTVSYHAGKPAIADDSGFFVDALKGEPGVYSARYLGDVSQQERNQSILDRLKGLNRELRTARFECVIAVVDVAQGLLRTFTGVCEGTVPEKIRGEGGFGYDPIFQPVGKPLTFAELSGEEKNRMSHRGRALTLFTEHLQNDADLKAALTR